jgi:Family of unknown function (DUF6311)
MLRSALIGGAVGGFIGLCVLPLGFITGTGAKWAYPTGDSAVYVIAWQYFLHDRWRLPIFNLPALNYPEGGNVIVSDAVPVATLFSKTIFSLTGVAINPFGWWILLTYILHGAMAARLVTACGVRSVWASVAAGVLAVCSIAFLWRIGHLALSGQFLILWALSIHFESVRTQRFKPGEHFLLSTIALLDNSYLTVMVAVLQVTTFLSLWSARGIGEREWGHTALIVIGVVAVALAEGYGTILSWPGTMRASGFGQYSWNLAALLIPPEPYWGLPHGIVHDATDGQLEGEAYIGLGAVLVLVTCIAARPAQVVGAVRRHWILAVTLMACGLYAASNQVYFGSRLILHVPLPDWALRIASYFRASGRFIWIPAYAITILSVAGLFKWTPRLLAIPVVLLAMPVQVREATLTFASIRASLSHQSPEPVDTPHFETWMRQHRRVFRFPSWACGTIAPAMTLVSREANRELQVDLIAARLGLRNNSAYMSRPNKNCGIEDWWAQNPTLNLNILYIVNKWAAGTRPALVELGRSASCIDVGWGMVCSRAPLSADPLRHDAGPISLEPRFIRVCDGSATGATTVRWRAPSGADRTEIHIGTPDGPIFAREPTGSKPTAVEAGTTFYLMDSAKPLADALALGKATAYFTRAGCDAD